MNKRLLVLLLGLIFTVVGIGLTIKGVNDLSNAKASSEWPTAEGRIVSSTVEKFRSTKDVGKRRKYISMYKPNIVYEYSVDGDTYTAENYTFVELHSSDAKDIRQITDRYPAGHVTPVYYSPEDAALSVLEPGVTWRTYMPLMMGLIFILASIGIIFYGLVAKQIR